MQTSLVWNSEARNFPPPFLELVVYSTEKASGQKEFEDDNRQYKLHNESHEVKDSQRISRPNIFGWSPLDSAYLRRNQVTSPKTSKQVVGNDSPATVRKSVMVR